MFNSNADFFPTPKNLIYKMLNKIDWNSEVKSILEPSAGKGDLVEGIISKFNNSHYHNRRKQYDIDTIEIDESLQHILRGKGHRVVHDNYLTYRTYKKYDVIIANFPFSEGDKHLSKSLELLEQQKGGKLVCIVNAETILNPYSNIRKEIVQKLESYNADIEYIENAFMESERKTGVSIALIYVNIPKVEHNSIIINELKETELHTNNNNYTSDKLINSDFIEGIVSQYNYEIKAGLKLIEEYNSLQPLMLRSFQEDDRPILKLDLEYQDNEGSSLENAYIKQIRAKYWKALFSNEQFMGLFTNNLKRQYMENISEYRNYDFSFFNIYTLRIQLSKEMIKGLEETILDLFEEFSHKHYYTESSSNIHLFNGWKTNKSYKVNKRVIIPLDAFSGWSDNPYRPTNYSVLDKLKDIEKVFSYLDDGSTEDIDITDTLKMAEHYQETRKIELKYFTVSFFKKGTCHLEFKDMKILGKFNIFGSQHRGWLPPSYGKASYKNMTKEEKEVIDQFEGERSYNEVMSDKDYYIMDTQELLQLTS